MDLELAFSSLPSFSLDLKLTTDKFGNFFVQEMQGKGKSISIVNLIYLKIFDVCISTDFTMGYIQKNGFSTPLLFRDKSGLDMKVPKSDFSVGDVRQCVGNFTN